MKIILIFIAIVLFLGIRKKVLTSNVPKHLQGLPIFLITAMLIYIAFLGFSGLI